MADDEVDGMMMDLLFSRQQMINFDRILVDIFLEKRWSRRLLYESKSHSDEIEHSHCGHKCGISRHLVEDTDQLHD